MPAAQARAEKRGPETVLEIGPETTAYTELIPALMAGLERVHGAKETRPQLRESVLQRLIARWEELVAYRVVWAPGLVFQLGELLGRLGRSSETPSALRLKVLRALRAREDHFPILDILSRWHDVEPGSAEVDRELDDLAAVALGFWTDPEYQSEEDREVLVWVLSRLARRPQLGGSKKASQARKEAILAALFEAARSGLPGAVKALAELAAAGTLPDALARDLAARLPRWQAREER